MEEVVKRPRGRPKLFDHLIELRLTTTQLRHLQARALASGAPVAGVVRALVEKDMQTQVQEVRRSA